MATGGSWRGSARLDSTDSTRLGSTRLDPISVRVWDDRLAVARGGGRIRRVVAPPYPGPRRSSGAISKRPVTGAVKPRAERRYRLRVGASAARFLRSEGRRRSCSSTGLLRASGARRGDSRRLQMMIQDARPHLLDACHKNQPAKDRNFQWAFA